MSTPFSHPQDQVAAAGLIARNLAVDPAAWRTWVREGQNAAPATPWPVFTGGEPPDPDNVITVYMAENQEDAKIQVTGEVQTHWGIRIRVRATDKPTAFGRLELIRHDLNEGLYMQTVTIGTTQYLIQSVPKCSPRPILEFLDGSRRWFGNLECLFVIQPYPFYG